MKTNSADQPSFVALLARAVRAGKPRWSSARPGTRGAAFLVGALALVAAGCAHLDTTPAGNPDRVLKGAVNFNTTVPAGAEVVVRLLEPGGFERPRGPANDVPVAAQPTPQRTERVLGEFKRTLSAATMQPVPFQFEYRAEDAVLRRGLNVDVRVSVDGKVRLRTISAHVVTLASSPFSQEIWVQPVR